MWTHTFTTILSGYRSRTFQVMAVLALCMTGAALLAGSFSGRQPQTVTLDVAISGMRIVGLMMVLFWVQDLVGREIDRRTVLLTLAYPSPRYAYVLGRFFGIGLLLVFMLTLLGLLAWLTASGDVLVHYKQASPPQWSYLPLVVAYLWLELTLVAAFTLLIAALSTTPFLPLALGAAFAVSGRLIGPVLEYLSRSDADKFSTTHFSATVNVLRWLLPDLSQLDLRTSVLYGAPVAQETLLFALLQAVVYTALLLTIAIQVFSRRQFES